VAERILPGGAPSAAPRPGAARAPTVSGQDGDLLVLLAELRRSRGRGAVRPHRLLSQVASEHARAMCEQQRLAHELAPGHDPESRLASAGVRARLVGETVARAPDAGTAFADLVQSPSHLLTLTEPRFTDAGAGQAMDASGRVCAVVMLAAWPRYVGR
jgi:uncharacterized protein YkwD